MLFVNIIREFKLHDFHSLKQFILRYRDVNWISINFIEPLANIERYGILFNEC